MGEDPIHDSLRRIAARLDALRIPYAVVGGMAVSTHGYARTTVDVDVLLRGEDLRRVHEELAGLGYRPPFPGSRDLRDTETGVRIEFLVSGDYPGDGRAKPVAFPDPASASVEIEGLRFLALERLIELKLASGQSDPGRLKDLADVQELTRALRLPRDFALRLDPSVRAKFEELRAGLGDP